MSAGPGSNQRAFLALSYVDIIAGVRIASTYVIARMEGSPSIS